MLCKYVLFFTSSGLETFHCKARAWAGIDEYAGQHLRFPSKQGSQVWKKFNHVFSLGQHNTSVYHAHVPVCCVVMNSSRVALRCAESHIQSPHQSKVTSLRRYWMIGGAPFLPYLPLDLADSVTMDPASIWRCVQVQLESSLPMHSSAKFHDHHAFMRRLAGWTVHNFFTTKHDSCCRSHRVSGPLLNS